MQLIPLALMQTVEKEETISPIWHLTQEVQIQRSIHEVQITYGGKCLC